MALGIFLINVPLGVLALLVGQRILPRSESRPDGRLDVVGMVLLCPGIALVVLGLSLAGGRGAFGSSVVLASITVGFLMIVVFVIRAWRIPSPLLGIRVLRERATGAGAVTITLFAAGYFGSAVVGPTYVQIVRGDSATLAGALGVPQALATGIALQFATRLVDRVEPRQIIGVGIAVALLGTVLRIIVLDAQTPYPLLAALGALSGLGIGATLMPTMAAATRALSGSRLGSASTVLNLLSQTAVAIGTAVVAATLSWSVGHYVPKLPAGGLTAASGLSPAARATYAPGLAEAARVSLGVTTILMVLAWLASRRLPQESSAAMPQPQRINQNL